MLPLWFNQYFLEPYPMLHRIGQALLRIGPDRLAYGSEGFIWPDIQAYIEMWANLEMPDELQDRYGYPGLTPAIKEKIFGRNFAEALGIDLDAKMEELSGD
jgi:predicted TIM-barrel fold metal-dependent hydrolase